MKNKGKAVADKQPSSKWRRTQPDSENINPGFEKNINSQRIPQVSSVYSRLFQDLSNSRCLNCSGSQLQDNIVTANESAKVTREKRTIPVRCTTQYSTSSRMAICPTGNSQQNKTSSACGSTSQITSISLRDQSPRSINSKTPQSYCSNLGLDQGINPHIPVISRLDDVIEEDELSEDSEYDIVEDGYEDYDEDQVFDCSDQEDTNSEKSEEDIQEIAAVNDTRNERTMLLAKCFESVFGANKNDSLTNSKASSSKSGTKTKKGQKRDVDSYIDDGDPDYRCQHCGALFWYGQRLNRRRNTRNPIYTGCCMQGQVKVPLLPDSPEELWKLFTDNDKLSRHFRENARPYNMVFSLTSLGGRVDRSVTKGRGPHMFTLQGENYHLMGSLKPKAGDYAKFSQLYIIDTENEVQNRLNVMSKGNHYQPKNGRNKFREEIIESMIKMLDRVHPHIKHFRIARDRFNLDENSNLQMRIVANRMRDGREYCLPAASEVAALIPGDFHENMDKRDIVLQTKSGRLKRIDELHPAYLFLQYPLLFPRGEDGFRLGIKKTRTANKGKKSNLHISMHQFFAFRLQERDTEKHVLLLSKRLLQQLAVDAYTMIESNRLRYVKMNQTKLRSTNIEAVKKAKDSGSSDLSNQGKGIALPPSFVGGPRYMQQSYLDAMATCKHFGFPDLFITFTCNPKWPEITRFMDKRGLKSDDRPDIIAKIFKIKLDNLMDDLTKKHIFGKTASAMYSVEFQKRGLPHAHILIWMQAGSKLNNADKVDKIISAEIPDKDVEPELYEVVKNCMIHGPCGHANTNSPCMVDGKCSKFFPKPYANHSKIDKEGFPVYRRRDTGRYVEKNGIQCDNKYVVPYNKKLSLRYGAYINVEWCNQSGSCRYLFKYVTKGPDRVTFTIGQNATPVEKDELQDFFDCRYVSACEAMWRIFGYEIHFRTTSVVKLSFHEEGKQPLYYKEDDTADEVIERFITGRTQFLAWFELNDTDALAKTLLYEEIPNYFTWKGKEKRFQRRGDRSFAIGRINYIPRKIEDSYYLRMLLNHQRGPTSFNDLKTVGGVLYPSYRDACFALGLLDDDKQYISAIKDASFICSAQYTRKLFTIMLMGDCLTKPEVVWEQTWMLLSEDILYKKRDEWKRPDLTLTDEEKQKYALHEIEKLLAIYGCSLRAYKKMPKFDMEDLNIVNSFILDEKDYDCEKLKDDLAKDLATATTEQLEIYNEILDAVLNDKGGVFFVYGFGGTGKTYLWKLLSAAIRSRGDIVLNVASSGIASLLLQGGRTAHSRFGIPIIVDEGSTCNMTRGSALGDLVTEAKLIIWDEAPMMSKYCFKCLDRSLKDILRCPEPFGGKVVVFGGDFRQILPITGAGRQEIVAATINSSYLWRKVKVLQLTKNMRLLANIPDSEKLEIEEFSKWLLDVGDGKISLPNDGIAEINLPEELLLHSGDDPIETIVQAIYGNSRSLEKEEPKFFQGRAILCPTNEDVNTINSRMLDRLGGDERVYLSCDSIDPTDTKALRDPAYGIDFLNKVKASGLPNHSLRLKIGCPVMLLRNVDPHHGLCNGTRLQITQLTNHVIEAKIITSTKVGDKVLLPKMMITPSDVRLPFKMRRIQFPLSVSFAMTINKSQGQTLSEVGLYLRNPVFSHGQLYVAMSRVSKKKGLKILALDKKGQSQRTTTNVVYKEVFQNLLQNSEED